VFNKALFTVMVLDLLSLRYKILTRILLSEYTLIRFSVVDSYQLVVFSLQSATM